MPAPPISFTPNPAALAADAILPASAIGSSSGPLPAIDLDHDRLQVCHLLEREPSSNPPDTAVLAGAAAKRQVGLPVVGRLIDVDPSHLKAVGKAKSAGQVARVHRAEEAIRRVVGQRERLLLVIELDDRSDRAERLLLAYPHRRHDAINDRGGVIEAGWKAFSSFAAEHQLCAPLQSVRD